MLASAGDVAKRPRGTSESWTLRGQAWVPFWGPRFELCFRAQNGDHKKRTLQKVWVFRFFDPGPGASGGPRKVPLGFPWAMPGSPGATRRPPGPQTNQTKTKTWTEQYKHHKTGWYKNRGPSFAVVSRLSTMAPYRRADQSTGKPRKNI